MKKAKYKINGDTESLDKLKMLEEWKKKFCQARAQSDSQSYLDELEMVYRGTKDTQANINSNSTQKVKKTNNVPNITYELIESKVNTSIPDAVVKSKKPGFENQAKMAMYKIMSDLDDPAIDLIADENERDTYVSGYSVIVPMWNVNKGNHEYVGETELVSYHPKQVIPQPNIYNIKKMDYCFFVGTRTKQDVYESTGVDVSSEEELYPEYNEIYDGDGDADNIDADSNTNELVSEVVVLFKDDDGDVGKFAWVGQTPTEYEPKYFYPRVKECEECGYESALDAEECEECGNKKLTTKVITIETIQEDMELSPISYDKTIKKVKTNPATGKKTVEEVTEQIVEERLVEKGTEIPIPAPKDLPIIIRKNVPLRFSFRGRSDVETIRDQQETIKKVMSKVEEKIVGAGSITTMSEKLHKQLSDDTYQQIKGRPEDLKITTQSFQADISQDLAYVAQQMQIARSELGITDSFQGKYDASAKSGKAKQVQIQQSQGRLQAPSKNKFVAFAQLFELMFRFDLCFSREPRPYTREDSNGEEVFDEFNRYEYLAQDAAGKWYFNTDFKFKAEMGSDLPSDKTWYYEQAFAMYSSQAISREQLLEILADLGFPIANRLLEQERASQEGMDERIEVLMIMQNMDPQTMQAFLQLPPGEQMQYLDDAREQMAQ